MQKLELTSEFITLAQALKVLSVVGSGGEAKNLIRDGGAQVNGQVETQPGRKLRAGDEIAVEGAGKWVIAGTARQGP